MQLAALERLPKRPRCAQSDVVAASTSSPRPVLAHGPVKSEGAGEHMARHLDRLLQEHALAAAQVCGLVRWRARARRRRGTRPRPVVCCAEAQGTKRKAQGDLSDDDSGPGGAQQQQRRRFVRPRYDRAADLLPLSSDEEQAEEEDGADAYGLVLHQGSGSASREESDAPSEEPGLTSDATLRACSDPPQAPWAATLHETTLNLKPVSHLPPCNAPS